MEVRGFAGREAQTLFGVQGESPRINRIGYAQSKDGCLPIDQLEPTQQLMPKKRGLTHPPSDHPARNVTEEWFYLFLLFSLNFNPSIPSSPLIHLLLSGFCSATQRPNHEKIFPGPRYVLPLRVPSLRLSFFLPLAPHIFSPSRKLDAGNVHASFPVI